MAHKAVYCIAQTEAQADRIVDSLQSSGTQTSDISVLFPDRSGSRDFAHEHNTKAPEGTVTGATTGGVLGGALGVLAGIGTLAIPGLGPFIAAGPIMAGLSGAAVGATVGGLAGALIGLGMPEYEAKAYETKIKGGNILIAVHAHDSDEVDRVKNIFKDAGAEDIGTADEEDVSDDQRAAGVRR
ncbi:MAG TPA: DUF3341 domain-containing protein [Gammaproteobacteria bacterium]